MTQRGLPFPLPFPLSDAIPPPFGGAPPRVFISERVYALTTPPAGGMSMGKETLILNNVANDGAASAIMLACLTKS